MIASWRIADYKYLQVNEKRRENLRSLVRYFYVTITNDMLIHTFEQLKAPPITSSFLLLQARWMMKHIGIFQTFWAGTPATYHIV